MKTSRFERRIALCAEETAQGQHYFLRQVRIYGLTKTPSAEIHFIGHCCYHE